MVGERGEQGQIGGECGSEREGWRGEKGGE